MVPRKSAGADNRGSSEQSSFPLRGGPERQPEHTTRSQEYPEKSKDCLDLRLVRGWFHTVSLSKTGGFGSTSPCCRSISRLDCSISSMNSSQSGSPAKPPTTRESGFSSVCAAPFASSSSAVLFFITPTPWSLFNISLLGNLCLFPLLHAQSLPCWAVFCLQLRPGGICWCASLLPIPIPGIIF